MTYRNAFFAATIAVAVVAVAQPAAAAEWETRSVQVSTAGIDLASEGGRKHLDRRLAQAARLVCGIPSSADLAGQRAARECREEAVTRARSELARAQDSDTVQLAAAR
jgi:UrcA family protein